MPNIFMSIGSSLAYDNVISIDAPITTSGARRSFIVNKIPPLSYTSQCPVIDSATKIASLP